MGVTAPVTVRETRIEAPKPKEFRGERSAQDVENFLWQMDAYFEHVNIQSEAAKIRTTTMYLTDTAMLWWRRKKADMEKGVCCIRLTSSIRDYVKEFTELTLQIPSLTNEDLLFYFMDGL